MPLPDVREPGQHADNADAAAADGAHSPMNPQVGAALHQILASLMNPAVAVHGDAVYSQEALDRIISSLMEANPLSNAAPPASQAAIERLDTKEVDDEMLGPEGRAECTICIVEVERGSEVAVLPCKHWFHAECVVMWLKEHNTCPVCRHPHRGRRQQCQQQQCQQQQQQQQQRWGNPAPPPAPAATDSPGPGRPERPALRASLAGRARFRQLHLPPPRRPREPRPRTRSA